MTPLLGSAATRIRQVLPDRAGWLVVRRQPGRDLLAGLTVAIVALPLALGFGVSSGLGAAAGLATAIVAGAIAAAFGGSDLQVSGPTGAMTVVLVPIAARHGVAGVLTVGLMAGLLLILLALAGAGRYIRYVPAPVVEGFTLGIAAVIFLQQVPAALGVATGPAENIVVATGQSLLDFARQPRPAAVALAVGVAVVMLLGARWRPTVPFSLLAVAAATLVTELAHLDVDRIGRLPATLPAPSLAFLDPTAMPALAGAAVAVAALAALESLLSATVADGMRMGRRHDPDRELFGQGLANLAAPLFGGIPATAAIARTAVNVRSGAASRLAAFSHAVILAGIMLVAAPLVGRIPLAALAGVLLATAIRMVEVGSLLALARATRSDALVMTLTAIATLALDLVAAVLIGLLVAGALALRKIAKSVRVEEVPLSTDEHPVDEWRTLAEHIVVYRLDGPLFFAAAHRFLLELSEVADVRAVVLRMSRVSTIDASGALVLGDAIRRLRHRGVIVYLSGLRPEHAATLRALRVPDQSDDAPEVFATATEAIEAARTRLRRMGLLPAATPVADVADDSDRDVPVGAG